MYLPSLSVWQPHQVGWCIYEEVQSILNVFSISQCLATTPSWLTYLWRGSEHIKSVFHLSVSDNHTKLANVFMKRFREHIKCVFHLSVTGNHIKLADVYMKKFRAYQMCFPSLSGLCSKWNSLQINYYMKGHMLVLLFTYSSNKDTLTPGDSLFH